MLDNCKLLWKQSESSLKDDDSETIGAEWRNRFNEEFDEDNAIDVQDIKSPLGGEAMVFVMPNGFLAVISFDGWSLYEPNTN